MTIAARLHAEEVLARVSRRVEAPDLDDAALPVLPALRGVLRGLRRGQVVEVDEFGALAIALIAGPSAAGAWCGLVGVPEFGVLAATAMGCDLERLLLVEAPGERWVDVVATLLEAVDVVLVRPPARPPSGVVRRLSALARRSGACLVVTAGWEGAGLRLRVESSLWIGVAQGHGRLAGRRVRIVAEGRGAAGRPRSSWLWLPGPDGRVTGADLASVEVG